MTALAATAQPGSAFTPPRVLLQVTGAPNPPTNAYTSNFATVNGWSSADGAVVTAIGGGPWELSVAGANPVTIYSATRSQTGLTVGVVYRFRVMAKQYSGNVSVGVVGIGDSAFTAPVFSSTGSPVDYTFTATATTHTLRVRIQKPVAPGAPQYTFPSMTVDPISGWGGTTIRRTDANGSSLVVREDVGGLDVAGGVMSLYDYEAALVGPVGYAVTDGAGAVAYASTTFGTGLKTNLVPNPSLEAGITGWLNSGTGTTSTVTTGGEFGTMRLRVVTGTGASSGASIIVPGVVPGVRYGARLRAQGGVASDFRITMQWLDAASAVLSSPSADFLGVASGAWVTAYTESTAPVGAAFVRVYLQRINSSTAGVVVNVDAALVRSLAVGEVFDPADYFDGSTTPTASKLYAWSGTPHLSPSIETSTAESTAGVWLSLPATAVPSLGTITGLPVQSVLSYDESSQSNGSLHEIIGRADPIANPGPLALRAGSFDVFCADYRTAKAVRTLLSTGDVAQLRQPTHPGLDLYFVAQDVRIAPADDDTTPRRWITTLTYAEVLAA